jgi:hypothetical protein
MNRDKKYILLSNHLFEIIQVVGFFFIVSKQLKRNSAFFKIERITNDTAEPKSPKMHFTALLSCKRYSNLQVLRVLS